MAAVLDALAPYVKKLITDMAEEEVSMLLGVSDEITKLGDKVDNLEAYVADAEKRRIDDDRVQRWVSKLKGALYDATDILELCQLDAVERSDKARSSSCWGAMEKKAPACLRPLLFCLRNPGFAHHIGGRIKELNANLDNILKEMHDFRFDKLDAYPLWRQPSEGTSHSRATTSLLDDMAVVGEAIEADTKSLVQELMTSEPGVKVVSITAAGGMGKTTLARKIFNDEAIKLEFGRKIWLSVTERYDPDKLLSSAITLAGGEKDPHGDKEVLTQTLCSTLSSAGKFLMVLDDVWSHQAWSDVLRSPIIEAGRKQLGSRLIITTRNEHLVKEMGGVATYHVHRVKPLLDEDAWSLLKKQLPAQDVGSDNALDLLKHVGIRIIRKCDGLPLAIKAIGGILRSKRATELEWNGVLLDPAWKTDKTHDDLNTALRLSYEDLSPSLKQCFLYYSLIPKGFWMHRDDVIGMWMSQGFLEPRNELRCNEVEDIGICYYRDLMTRNLIYEFGQDGSMMHDVIRSFARHMAKEEALAIGPDQITSLVSSSKIRRLSIDEVAVSGLKPDWSMISERQEYLRSLIICSSMRFEPNNSDFLLSRFVSLRALFLYAAESDRFARSLGNLKHLRFLLLWKTDVSQLPEDIGNLRFLEHIHMQKCASFDGKIPRSMLKVGSLRYLSIYYGTKFTPPKGLGRLTNLRTLQIFPLHTDGEWCSLQEIGPLSRLRKLSLENLETVPSASLAAKAKVRDKEQLRDLFYACYKRGEVPSAAIIDQVTAEDCQRVEEVFDQLCPPPQLEKLFIDNYIGRHPPSWMCMKNTGVEVYFNSLTSLRMLSLPLCTQLPDGLCCLPRLEILRITDAPAIKCIGSQFQTPSSMAARASAASTSAPFPRLRVLHLEGLREWEEWEWNDCEELRDVETAIAMPCLEKLVIENCKLSCLPLGLASSRRQSLRQLYLYELTNLTYVENFPSVMELDVFDCPELKRITGLPMLQKIRIVSCAKLEVLEGVAALDSLVLTDATMDTLPGYLQDVSPRYFKLNCNKKLHQSSLSQGSSEWNKISHIGKPNINYIEDFSVKKNYIEDSDISSDE